MPKHEVVIIGAGPAGIECALTLRKAGVDCAIIERDNVGGVCTNWGCVPAKAMIASAKMYDEILRAEEFGIECSEAYPNFQHIADRRNNIVHEERAHLETLLSDAGVHVYRGEATVQNDTVILVKMGQSDAGGAMEYSGHVEELAFDQLVFATGSKEWMPPGINPHDPHVYTAGEIMMMNEFPEELVVIGGGFIGVELASMYSSLGSKVTILEYAPRILTFLDEQVSSFMEQALHQKGVTIKTNCRVDRVENQQVFYTFQNGSSESRPAAYTLVATGRRSNVPREWVSALGLDTDDKGRINIDDSMQTSYEGVWIIGDASGYANLAHIGMLQGRICGANVAALQKMDHPREMFSDEVVPSIVYSHPEVASIGIVPDDADNILVRPWNENLRAKLETQRSGFIKLWFRNHILEAAQIVGHNAGELIMQCCDLIQNETDLRTIKDVIAPHPSYSEMLWDMLKEG